MISAPPRNHIPEARIGDFSGTLPPQRSEEAQGRKRSSARRDNDFPAALIRDYTDLEILAETEEGDAYLFASKDKRIAFVTGHPEYDANTLASEFFRDVEAGLDPQVPHNYFPQNDPQNKPRATWRSHGNLLFINWLNYYVYQITPYDLRHMNPTLD